ncbi:RHS repeat-associated core domain-containing protein, partial [Salmonella enterica]|nr:RHS repeat-associated core domain-containing protein [Salmonella enterica subsp. enterica serovar Dublin]EHT4424030.1 RHS repeat-associated core domain-containing protein [Salmonella enterica]
MIRGGWYTINTNGAIGDFGVYKIEINGELYKYGKTDMNRVTKSSGLPTRLHQQVTKLEKTYGK